MTGTIERQSASLEPLTAVGPTAAAPRLLVTIDTEEEGLWGGEYRREGNTVENIHGVPRFQELCETFDLRPTYLVDTPVATADEAVAILRPIQDEDRGEIGAHLHPWCAPPLEEPVNGKNSFQCNLSADLQRAKLAGLTELIASRFGRRPTSFRAGRYGLDVVGARLLEELGYVVDSSVVPFIDYSDRHGPDFSDAPYTPYRVGRESLCEPGGGKSILEVPVSVGYTRGDFFRTNRLRRFAASPALRPLHLVGILDRLNIVRRVKFSPEQADAEGMKRLVDAFIRHGARSMVMMLHSSSLTVGHSPYVPDAPALERLYSNLSATFAHCRRQHGMIGQTLTQFALTYA